MKKIKSERFELELLKVELKELSSHQCDTLRLLPSFLVMCQLLWSIQSSNKVVYFKFWWEQMSGILILYCSLKYTKLILTN